MSAARTVCCLSVLVLTAPLSAWADESSAAAEASASPAAEDVAGVSATSAGQTHAVDHVQDYRDEIHLAAIARFDDLPTRLYLRPEFLIAQPTFVLTDEFLQTFIRALEGDFDDEVHFLAARSLERVAREKLADPELFRKLLARRLKASDSRNVRHACALALAQCGVSAAVHSELLADVCLPGDEVVCSVIEPRLAEWQSGALLSVWEDRIRQPQSVTRTQFALACRGAAALNMGQLRPELLSVVLSDTIGFSRRRAAAEAVSVLSRDDGFSAADRLSAGTTQDRVLAALLLQNAESDAALSLAEMLADDSEDAVASLAWSLLLKQDAQRLTGRLESGHRHRDPNVRSTVVKVVQALPTLDRCDLLNQMMSDQHIGVRNEARAALQLLAGRSDEFRQRVCTNAADVTGSADAGWQQLEQALLLQGVLRHDACCADCVTLLRHERPEVLVTAAWVLHLMPRSELAEPAVAVAIEGWTWFRAGEGTVPQRAAFEEQLVYLCHLAAYTNRQEIADLCRDQFSKASPLTEDSRAAALWTLGMLFAGSEDVDLMGRYVARVFDDGLPPEYEIVKSTSALSLGLLGNRDAIPQLRTAEQKYGLGGMLGACVSTALQSFGESVPPLPPVVPSPIGGWPLAPATSRSPE